MAKLTDTQLIVLSAAAAREDGLATRPARLTSSAATKVGLSLVARKLMREIRARPGMPAWRDDQEGRGISLMITRAGRDAIGVDEAGKSARPAGKSSNAEIAVASSKGVLPRAGSKQGQMIGLLSAKTGATLDALIEATGWLPHTTRAALTGLRKRGYVIERSREDNAASVYRIVRPSAAAA